MRYAELQALIVSIYGERNADVAPIWLIWDMSRYLGELTKLIRKKQITDKDVAICVARIIARAAALDSLLSLNMWEAFREEYPNQCKGCGRGRCVCAYDKPPEETEVFERLVYSEETSLRVMQNVLFRMYGDPNKEAGQQAVCLHLHEEIGEVAGDLRRNEMRRLAVELAQVVAHTIALANLYGINIDTALLDHYGDGCPNCGQTPCECPPDY